MMRKISLTACRMAFFSMDHIILTWPASKQIYWNKRKRLHKKRVQLPHDWFGTPTWPQFHCFGTPIWSLWRQVKTLYKTWLLLKFRQGTPPSPKKASSMIFCCRTVNCSQTPIIQTLTQEKITDSHFWIF